MEQNKKQKTSKSYNLFSAIAAFVMWGIWAYYVNSNSNLDISRGLISGVTQGAASFTITLFMVRAIAWLYNKLPRNILPTVIPAIITVSFTGSCLALAHYLVGTPNIITTISFPLSVAFAFCVYTAYKLQRQSINLYKEV